MSVDIFRNAIALARRNLALAWLALGVAILFALYMGFLGVMASREEARVAAERRDHPARYLDEVRSRQGMEAYIEELAQLRDFDDWRDQAPIFLIGAWALADVEWTRVGDDPGRHCLSGLVIEDGQMRYFGERTGRVGARYRIEGHRVLVSLADGGEISMTVPPDPWHEHQLLITLPDREAPFHGFRCTLY